MTESLRESLDGLSNMLGKSPAGHRIAYACWLEMAREACRLLRWEDLPLFQVVKTDHGRVGYLALAFNALDGENVGDFINICIGAAAWEAQRVR